MNSICAPMAPREMLLVNRREDCAFFDTNRMRVWDVGCQPPRRICDWRNTHAIQCVVPFIVWHASLADIG
jgi:hypothetical protein